VIVNGQTNLLTEVIAKLVLKGFKEENIQIARLDMAGNVGDYVAMVWPSRQTPRDHRKPDR
jgi:hypothetical protein